VSLRHSVLLAALAACSGAPTPPRVATPPAARPVTAWALARHPEAARLELPASTRSSDRPIRDAFSPITPFERGERGGGSATWKTALPVHASLFPTRQAGARTFGFYAPPDVQVAVRGHALSFVRNGAEPWSWGYTHDELLIGLPPDEPAPQPADVVITWPRAAQEEAKLHLGSSGLDAAAFAHRSLALGMDGHTGLLLPAPGAGTWSFTVPERGRLAARATVLPPAIADVASDGAQVRVEVIADGAPTEVKLLPVRVGDWVELSVDLSRWAGRAVDLRLSSVPGATPTADLVFLEDPTVYTPQERPRRVVVAFLDTVRRDHLGMYGYARPTSPRLDAWARDALVFDRHRTVAPWTLPSARAALTGAQPERWDEVQPLASRLAAAGFYTDGLVANAFLSPTFDMHRGFASYTFDHLRPAPKVVDHALQVLADHPDRDVLVYVQFMEAHLPYREPKAYQGLFAGDKPASLKDVSKVELDKVRPNHPEYEAIRQHVTDRYDQNLRVLDDELARLIAEMGDDATIVLFSDHGEELWEHGGFEHGHAFWEELLSVPMIVRDPHLPPGRLEARTSLLDLVPTVLELQGLDATVADGRSVVAAAFGDAAAQAALSDRSFAFGRPLYGDDGWGVLAGDRKSWVRGAAPHGYDLAADAQERADLGLAPGWDQALSGALGSPVQRVWRVDTGGAKVNEPVHLELSHPGGLVRVWKAYDPRSTTEGLEPRQDGDRWVLDVPAGRQLPSALYVLGTTPQQPVGLKLSVRRGATTAEATCAAAGDELIPPTDERLKISVDSTDVPLPFGTAVPGFSPALSQQLKELGYHEE
jgi:arylsulfatase A-like enzyme